MIKAIFVSDLHGKTNRFQKLSELIKKELPDAVFIGGDIFPNYHLSLFDEFLDNFLPEFFKELKQSLQNHYPEFFLILGNDDPKSEEENIIGLSNSGLFSYVHNRTVSFKDLTVTGYSNVPPTPFLLKDWEKYDVSRFVDPGCIAPDEGKYTIAPDMKEKELGTIADDLLLLSENTDMSKAIFLFHSPPYKTNLDRAALDGKMVEHVPVDVHIGSIAIKNWIEKMKPYITLHGHVHESTRLTGKWMEKIGNSFCFQAANDSKELSAVIIDLYNPENAKRILM